MFGIPLSALFVYVAVVYIMPGVVLAVASHQLNKALSLVPHSDGDSPHLFIFALGFLKYLGIFSVLSVLAYAFALYSPYAISFPYLLESAYCDMFPLCAVFALCVVLCLIYNCLKLKRQGVLCSYSKHSFILCSTASVIYLTVYLSLYFYKLCF